MLHALFQAIFHNLVNDFLCNWIPEGMRDCAAANTYFVSNVLLLPALYVKLDDLHVYWLEGLQGNVVGRGHDCAPFSCSMKLIEIILFLSFLCGRVNRVSKT